MFSKSIASIIFSVLVLLSATQCGGAKTAVLPSPTSTPTFQDLIIGKWETGNGVTQVSFNKEGIFRRNIDQTAEEIGTYEIQGADLNIIIEEQSGRLKIDFPSDDILIIETEIGEIMKFQRSEP